MPDKSRGFAHLVLFFVVVVLIGLMFVPIPQKSPEGEVSCMALGCPKPGWSLGPSLVQKLFGKHSASPAIQKWDPSKLCDFNTDFICDHEDEKILNTSFGKCRGETEYNFEADLNADGCVTSKDKENFATMLNSQGGEGTGSWKTYTNKVYGVSLHYPQEWTLGETIHPKTPEVNDQLVLVIYDNQPLKKPGYDANSSNRVVIYNDNRETNKLLSIKEASKSLIDHTINYIPGISYNSPSIENEDKIKLGSKEAVQYQVKMNDAREYSYLNDTAIITHVINKQRLWSIELYGHDQDTLGQILSTFKFTDVKVGTCVHDFETAINTLGITFREDHSLRCSENSTKPECEEVDVVGKALTDPSGPDGIPDCKWIIN